MDDLSEKKHDLTPTLLAAQESLEAIRPPHKKVLAIPRKRWCRLTMQQTMARYGQEVVRFCTLGWICAYQAGVEDALIPDIARHLLPELRGAPNGPQRQLAIAAANDLYSERIREEAVRYELAKLGIELRVVDQDSVAEYMAAWKEEV